MIVYDLVPCRLLLATCPSGRRQLFHILEQPSNSNWFSFYPFHNVMLWHTFPKARCSFYPFHNVIFEHTFAKAWYSSTHSLVQSLDWKSSLLLKLTHHSRKIKLVQNGEGFLPTLKQRQSDTGNVTRTRNMEAIVSKMEQKPSPWQQGEFAGACDDGEEVGLSVLQRKK